MVSYYQQISDFVDQAYDDRIEHLPLMGSIYKILTLVTVYLIFVKKIGPKFMESRQPYNLTTIMQFYNAFQVITNSVCVILFVNAFLVVDISYFACPMPFFTRSELDINRAYYVYVYYMLKVLDLTDTVFIILKKNYRQASFLHIYHHTIMALGAYINTQYYPGGAYVIPGTINTFVHVCMYSYFFITTIRPDFKKSIWWKKQITHVQLLQFGINFVYFSRVAFNENCKYSKFWSYLGVTQNLTFVCMFLNFYLHNYIFVKTKENKIK